MQNPPTASSSLYMKWRLALVIIVTILAAGLLLEEVYGLAAHFGAAIRLYFEAWVLQFLLAPEVDWLCRRGWKRGIAAGVVYLAAVVLAVGALVSLVPLFLTPLSDFARSVLTRLSRLDVPTLEAQLQLAIREHAPHSIQGPLSETVKNASSQLQALAENLSRYLLSVAQSITAVTFTSTFNLVGRTLSVMFSLFLTLILSFFMMTLGRPFVHKGISYLPRRLDPDIQAVLEVINRAFGGFVRGQLLLSGVYAALIFVILQAFAYLLGGGSQTAQYAIVAAILGGLIMVIPAIGTTLSMFPPMLVGAIALPGWPQRIGLIVAIWLLNLFMANILGPRVMSEAVGVNTLWTFGALIVGAELGGIVGAFFAVPILAVVLTVIERVYGHLVHAEEKSAAPVQATPTQEVLAVRPPPV